jgi:isoleucyl-tRNA synthetase
MDNFDARGAGSAIESFVDELSNWYVRRNRRRFWKGAHGNDKLSAYLTLYECLETVQRLIAPFMPFMAEDMYQNLVHKRKTDAPLSVHMTDWPTADEALIDEGLLHDNVVVQRVVGLGRSAREAHKLRVRQPLSRLLVRVPNEAAAQAVRAEADEILEELNVKTVEPIARDAGLVSYRIKPNLPRIGKRYGKLIPAIRAALNDADGGAIAAAAAAGESYVLEVSGTPISFEPDDLLIETESAQGYACAEEEGFLVALDTTLTPELEQEGLSREIVRSIQDARKQAGLDVADRIALRVTGDDAIAQCVAQYRDFIARETLTITWADAIPDDGFSVDRNLGDIVWTIELAIAQ